MLINTKSLQIPGSIIKISEESIMQVLEGKLQFLGKITVSSEAIMKLISENMKYFRGFETNGTMLSWIFILLEIVLCLCSVCNTRIAYPFLERKKNGLDKIFVLQNYFWTKLLIWIFFVKFFRTQFFLAPIIFWLNFFNQNYIWTVWSKDVHRPIFSRTKIF